ncbi:Alginate biosynthesis transcriptional activator [Pseudomonas orientalis]|uniref:Arc family DNA-binding protein n=1 Tax=Pseudomonas orientalis TaxID=76758 RepID=UPI000F6DD60A|nr:Arc family DNA-binding protein [Pseudomonas orientalis]AZE96669.1 Alginate biosynthesis transcriptional activator [Pseudomonas orientalis]
MSATNYDSRTADKFVVRLPDGLRADIEAAANAGDRSMNSVFIQAVRQYLDGQNRQQILLDVLANTVTAPMRSDSMHIDERVRMAANSRRYEWLRDEAFSANNQILVRDHFGNLLTKNDLDREIDRAKKSFGGMPETSTCAE